MLTIERKMDMASIGNDVKTFFLKGMEALGKAAGSITESAQQKLSEMNLAARRDEIRKALPDVLMQMWKNGLELPHELDSLLQELNDLEEQLVAAKAKPEPAAEAETPAEESTFEEAAETLEDKVEQAVDAVSDFVESKFDKVEEAVENMVDSLRKDEPSDENQD